MFRATTNHIGKNGDKKQKTLPYTLQVKVMEVCLVGAGDESRAFGGAPRSAIINCRLCRRDFHYPSFARQSVLLSQNGSTLDSRHNALILPKTKAPSKGALFLEQVTRVELAGNSLGSCRHTARRHLHCFSIISAFL